MSLHFRGSLHLVQFAVYQLSASPKRDLIKDSSHHLKHSHINKQHAGSEPEPEIVHRSSEPCLKHGTCKGHIDVAEKDIIYATIDGTLVSWINNWSSSGSAASPTLIVTATRTHALPLGTTAVTSASKGYTDPGNYIRTGYYDAKSQHLEGLTFLGNKGGAGSGAFD